jgi:hypothetical protein
VQWAKYDGPGIVTFANPSAAQTTASFSLPGRYTLLLRGDDGLHTPAYDAVVVHALFQHELLRSGADIIVRFPSVLGRQYRVERASTPNSGTWLSLADAIPGTGNAVQVMHQNGIAAGQQFYRVTVLPQGGSPAKRR